MDDDTLEGMFEAARAAPPQVPEALMARVLADAQATQPRPKVSRWGARLAGLGGVPGLGGLALATCVGFWLGVAPPQGLPDLAGAMLGVETETDDSLDALGLSGFGWDIEEG
ncbi:MAG: hypothetical protein AB8B60_04140 [Sulfitobacter sp.]